MLFLTYWFVCFLAVAFPAYCLGPSPRFRLLLLVGGPVKPYEEFVPALRHGVRRVCDRDVALGILQVAVGLVKKFIADNLTAYIHYHEAHFGWMGPTQRWWLFVAIAFRILLDFS